MLGNQARPKAVVRTDRRLRLAKHRDLVPILGANSDYRVVIRVCRPPHRDSSPSKPRPKPKGKGKAKCKPLRILPILKGPKARDKEDPPKGEVKCQGVLNNPPVVSLQIKTNGNKCQEETKGDKVPSNFLALLNPNSLKGERVVKRLRSLSNPLAKLRENKKLRLKVSKPSNPLWALLGCLLTGQRPVGKPTAHRKPLWRKVSLQLALLCHNEARVNIDPLLEGGLRAYGTT